MKVTIAYYLSLRTLQNMKPCMITVYCGVSIQSYVLLFFKSVVGQNQKLVGPVNTDAI